MATPAISYRPGSELVLADTLSRAYPPSDATDDRAEFTEELASLTDNEQMQQLRAVASLRTIDFINAASADDEEYLKLMHQIAVGWSSAPATSMSVSRPTVRCKLSTVGICDAC